MGETDWMTVDVGSARNMDRRSIGVERSAWQARESPGLPTLNIGTGGVVPPGISYRFALAACNGDALRPHFA